ncbi:MAG: DUF413 domain-containing protein, partial [Aeromonas sobria]
KRVHRLCTVVGGANEESSGGASFDVGGGSGRSSDESMD